MCKKKTTEEYKEEIYSLVGEEYTVLGKYSNNKTHILMRHNSCNNEYEVRPDAFFNGCRCPKCSGKERKDTKKFKEEIYSLVGEEYTVLGEYVNANTKIEMKHNVCGNEYEVKPNSFLNGRRCPKCAIQFRTEKRRKSNEKFKEEVFELVGDAYTIIGEYIDDRTKIKMRHNYNKCDNYQFEMTPNAFLRGERCPKCGGAVSLTTEEYIFKVKEIADNEYSVLSNYIGIKEKIKMRHNCKKCNNYEWEVQPYSFLSGHRCPKCAGKIKKTTEQFKEEMYSLVGEEYTVLGEYVNADTKIKMKHNCEKCNNYEWEVQPYNFLQNGSRCPMCCSSRGEERINKILTQNNISFKREYKITDCKDIKPLPFDFALFDNKGNLKMLIEYQGIQHFYYFQFFFKKDEDFVDRIMKDNIKRAYCEYNNILLLEISYTDYERIEEILNDKISCILF